MATKIDIKRLHESLAHDMKFTGSRVTDVLKEEYAKDADVIAAAILCSALSYLSSYAQIKVLGPADIKVALDAAMEGAKVTYDYDAMGVAIFKRKEA